MKILYIQLARLGDIYLTWPILNASLRIPDGEVHLLVRESFKGATHGLDPKVQVHTLDVKSILTPLYEESEQAQEIALLRLEKSLSSLYAEHFDRVVNLTFSPLSSHLTRFLQTSSNDIRGYSRHSDGFLNIPDDASAYFYSQVGINKPNRFHLSDVFASVAGVELELSDWRVSNQFKSFAGLEAKRFVVFHTGGSQNVKRWGQNAWSDLIESTLDQWKDLSIVLIGKPEESIDLVPHQNAIKASRLIPLYGKTEAQDLLSIIYGARTCVGPDSVAMHIASLTNTPCVNLSSRAVNFWETGPLAEDSLIVLKERMDQIGVDDVSEALRTILEGREVANWPRVIPRQVNQPRYRLNSQPSDDLAWNLVSSMYCGSPLPVLDQMDDLRVFCQVRDLCQLALQEIDHLTKNPNRSALSILEAVDSGLNTIGTLSQVGQVLVSWFGTEKIRIGPQPFDQLIVNTQKVYKQLLDFCTLFTGDLVLSPEGKIDEIAEMVP